VVTTNRVLDICQVRKSFGDELVLNDISLSFDEHKVTALIGASGSGKSTLLRCINLLEEIDDGQILLTGQDITAVGTNADQVRKRIGSVFQAYNLFPHLTVLQNITLAPILVHGTSKVEANNQANLLLHRFGLTEKAEQYPERLSGGQQQRVAIIRAIATNPQLLLLDEVTSALDPVLIAEVLSLINELKLDGMTMLIATHEMGFARKVADEVIFLEHGCIHEAGSPTEMLENPKTPELQNFLNALKNAGRI
jgi:polar amino acid transport system ATP-binding protein